MTTVLPAKTAHAPAPRATTPIGEPTLSVRDLVIECDTPAGPRVAVDGVSFDVFPNEVVCIVGESGSGKSLTMLAIMGLLPQGVRVASGTVTFQGRDLLAQTATERRNTLGRDVAMIFQDPMTSLNPVIRVGKQIAEMIRLHDRSLSRKQVKERVVELLRQVRIPSPDARARAYPHEFSGGMLQRAMIAMAMAHDPALLIADEPTTALDVTIQAQVLHVLRDVRERLGTSMALITHDLGVVAETADRVVVMYAGQVVETGSVHQIFHAAKHPYTIGLLASSLRADRIGGEAYAIPGIPPSLTSKRVGCSFGPRCWLGGAEGSACCSERPELLTIGVGPHRVSCHHTADASREAHARALVGAVGQESA